MKSQNTMCHDAQNFVGSDSQVEMDANVEKAYDRAQALLRVLRVNVLIPCPLSMMERGIVQLTVVRARASNAAAEIFCPAGTAE